MGDDDRVPVGRGDARQKARPLLLREIRLVGDQDAGRRVELQELARRLREAMPGHDPHSLRDQTEPIWRIIAAGSTYIAHTVGAGKTFSIAAAIIEQKRLGLVTKAMWVVPGHCLAQAA